LNLPMSRHRAFRPPPYFFPGIALCCVAIVGLAIAVVLTQESGPPKHFFLLTQAKLKASDAKVTLKMTVERVFQKEGDVFAEIEGCPADVNFTTGEGHPSRWIPKESSRQRDFLRESDPSARPAMPENVGRALGCFMTEDDLLFEWPPTRGRKYCGAESAKREDEMHRRVLESDEKKDLDNVTGAASGSAPALAITYCTNPHTTQTELSRGIAAITAWRYHHHGTTGATDLKLAPSSGGTQ